MKDHREIQNDDLEGQILSRGYCHVIFADPDCYCGAFRASHGGMSVREIFSNSFKIENHRKKSAKGKDLARKTESEFERSNDQKLSSFCMTSFGAFKS